jgi:hypothetical protein
MFRKGKMLMAGLVAFFYGIIAYLVFIVSIRLSLFTGEGFASVKAAEAYTRARKLAEQRGDARQQFMAFYGLW